ncbi:MAG: ThuA domain-containing protein, partial [Verrucomicrobiales bacterium]|nr:ThuA domain-containing protein [Verrucomicrobiales bacterium]
MKNNGMIVRALMVTALAAVTVSGALAARTEFGAVKPEYIPKIDAAIPALTVTPAKPRKVLLFSRTEGFTHGSIPAGIYLFTALGAKTGAYTAVPSGDMEMFTPEKLAEFDAVILN